ncbi:MAG: alpha/beta fold hydrolase [Saprospiraceae bacterium]
MSDTGTGTILIHGFGFDLRTWYPLELAFEGHNVIYLALPGFGPGPIAGPYSIAELAKNYWIHLDALGIEQISLVGHSMGGYVCLEMLALHPERVLSLALIHSHVYADSEEKKRARNETIQNITSKGTVDFINKFIPSLFADTEKSSGVIRMLIKRASQYESLAWIYGSLAMRDRVDLAGLLASIKIPVLMLMGESDRAVPADLGLKQALLGERIALHLYPGIGHMGMYENTQELIEDLIRFYAELPL